MLFWKQGSKAPDYIGIDLTHSENELLCKAAKTSGNGRFAVFAHTMLLEQAKALLDNRGGNTTDG